MSDSISAELDATDLITALTALGPDAQPYVNEASHDTADAIVREAKSRLQRQLGPNATGATAAGLSDRPAYDGNGYVVVDEREPFPSLPFWIEKGTKKGAAGSHTEAARPFFYVSVDLERGAHERRIGDALQHAIDAKGLGS